MKKKSNQTKTLILLTVAFCFMLAWSGKSISDNLDKKIRAQTQITDRFQRWLVSYQKLESVKEDWAKTFADGDEVQSLRSLYRLLNLEQTGLLTNPVKLQVDSYSRVLSPTGFDLGLTQVCLHSQSRRMVVSADTFSGLLTGLDRLENRQDLMLGEIEIRPGERPTAEISKFCTLLRDPAS